MKLKAYEKIIWMIEPGAGPKGFLLVSPERCTLTVTQVALLVVGLMKDCFQTNPTQGTKLKCGHTAKYLCKFYKKV